MLLSQSWMKQILPNERAAANAQLAELTCCSNGSGSELVASPERSSCSTDCCTKASSLACVLARGVCPFAVTGCTGCTGCVGCGPCCFWIEAACTRFTKRGVFVSSLV